MSMKFNIVIRNDKQSENVSKELNDLLLHNSFTRDEVNPDFVFCVGGDGTFLKAVHLYKTKLKRISFIGIHTGSLGYFADFGREHLNELISDIIEQNIITRKYRLVEAHVTQAERTRKFYAVNEVKVENVHHTLVLDVYLNGRLLENYRGNGVLVCSQLGSTGYNKSIGGSLIRRNLELLQYTKIAPISNSVYRPLINSLILSDKDELVFKGHNAFTYFGYDSLTKKLKDVPFAISVKLSKKKVTIVHSKKRHYTNIIREAFLK